MREKKYGFKVDGKVGYLDPESGKEVIEVVLPQEKTTKLLDSLFEVIERTRRVGGR